jgi:hypothetical protein
MLESIRRTTNYALLRTFLTVTAALAIVTAVAAGLFATFASRGDGFLIALVSTAFSVCATLAARMFALMLVDIADTLQWQCRHMAKSEQAE